MKIIIMEQTLVYMFELGISNDYEKYNPGQPKETTSGIRYLLITE